MTLTRGPSEGFGFVILSSVRESGSTIGELCWFNTFSVGETSVVVLLSFVGLYFYLEAKKNWFSEVMSNWKESDYYNCACSENNEKTSEKSLGFPRVLVGTDISPNSCRIEFNF